MQGVLLPDKGGGKYRQRGSQCYRRHRYEAAADVQLRQQVGGGHFVHIGERHLLRCAETLLQRGGIAALGYVALGLGAEIRQSRFFPFAGARQEGADRPDIPSDVPILLPAHASPSPLIMAKTPAVTVSYSAISSRSFASPVGSRW